MLKRRYNCTVCLNDQEYALACLTAKARNALARKGNFRQVNFASVDDLPGDTAGAKGECGFSVWQLRDWANRLWMTKEEWQRGTAGRCKPPDFEPNIEIRTVGNPWKQYHLLIQKQDLPERIFVLATSYPDSHYENFLGWLQGHQAKQEMFYGDWGRTGRPCYWVPEESLHSMSDLPGLIWRPAEAWRIIYDWNDPGLRFA